MSEEEISSNIEIGSEPPNNSKPNYILNRESWFKIILISVAAIVIGYKIIEAPVNFDFSDFRFSDFLSLSLAIFSIGLAVAFYFKATEMSNKFYDNTYKFTKDISEILGRIEAGFGEKLKHLDEGYTGLVDKFDSTSFSKSERKIEEAEKEFEEEKERLEAEINERNKILDNVMQRAQLQEHEKEELLKTLDEKDKQITKLKKEMGFLKKEISAAERNQESELFGAIPNRIIQYFKRFVFEYYPNEIFLDAPNGFIKREVDIRNMVMPSKLKHDLKKHGLIDDESLTNRGIEILKKLARE